MIRQDPSGREEARLKQLELELYQDQVRVLESRANDLGDKKSAEKLQAARARVLELQLQTERQAAARTKQLEAWFDEADPSAARHGPGAAPVQVRTARAHAGEGGEDRKSHTMVGFLEETVRHLQKSLDNEQRQRTEETEALQLEIQRKSQTIHRLKSEFAIHLSPAGSRDQERGGTVSQHPDNVWGALHREKQKNLRATRAQRPPPHSTRLPCRRRVLPSAPARKGNSQRRVAGFDGRGQRGGGEATERADAAGKAEERAGGGAGEEQL